MFWSGEKLKVRLPTIILNNYDSDRIDCAAYTLTMGSEVYVSPPSVTSPHDVVGLGDHGSFNIPPGQFAFLLTEERLKIPADVLGLINMKSRIKLRGLVNVSGFHVDPGYEGKLVFAVFNAGPKHITIRRGDPCFLLWLSDLAPNELSTDTNADFALHARNPDTGYDRIDSHLVSNIGGTMLSLFGLNEKIDKMQATTDKLFVVFSIVLTLLGATLLGEVIELFSRG